MIITPEFWIENKEECQKYFNENFNEIPEFGLIPEINLKNGDVVKFRGMIQDMDNPVYFFEKIEIEHLQSGERKIIDCRFKEDIHVDDNYQILYESSQNKNGERRKFRCITIPAVNNWANPLYYKSSTVESAGTDRQFKRQAETMDIEMVPKLSEQISAQTTNNHKKLCSKEESNVSEEAQSYLSVELNADSPHSNSIFSDIYPVNGPNNYSCVVEVYDDLKEELKMNDVVEIIGFIYLNCPFNEEENEQGANNVKIVKVHAMTFRKITSSNPYSTVDNSIIDAKKQRNDLHLILTHLLLGDSLAAEYFICHLISKIYLRKDCLVLGKLSLNLSNVPSNDNYTEEIYKILSKLVTKSYYLSMTLDQMNSLRLLPEKDYENSYLKSGLLQLSNQTHVVLDETKLKIGQLADRGVRNVAALSHLITDQSVKYNFKYYDLDFQTDLPVLILSEGKSLLPSDVHVILTPEPNFIDNLQFNEIYLSLQEYLKEPFLNELRCYLSAIPHSDFILAEALLNDIQNDYVNMRQREAATNQDDLHLMLVLARLMSISYGQSELTKDIWEKVLEMEILRKQRMSK